MNRIINFIIKYLRAECDDMAYIIPFVIIMTIIIYATH